MIKENNGWLCIDLDHLQYFCKKEHEVGFRFIQVVWLDTCGEDERPVDARDDDDDHYAICAGYIDLDLYSAKEKEESIVSYGYTMESINEEYGDDTNQIIAECLFEDYYINDNYSIAGVVSWEEAKKIVQKYINEN